MITYILIVIIIILLSLIISSYSKIKYICRVIDEILSGNLNQRIRLQNNIKPLNKLISKINSIIDKFQESNSKNIENEETRKKMISNISHDLRTPLTSMLGYMELIFDDKELSHEKKEEYLKIIYDKGNSLYDLMEEFFQVSKLDSNDIKVTINKVNISEIVRQSVVSFFAEIQKHNIEPKINIGDKDIYIFSDGKIINRILSNLINNAIKHGFKAVSLGVNLSCDENNVFLEVWDNGAGIPEEEINHIFERLYTVEKSRNANLKNSGLGLTIVHKLVKVLGGEITLSSIPFEKTSFKVKLPRRS